MNKKAFIMSLYVVALFIVLSRWYKAGNKGIPEPSYVTAPSYLYGVLALTSDFLAGLPIVLAAGFTTGLYFAVHPVKEAAASTVHPSATASTESPGGVQRGEPQRPNPQTRKVK